MQRERRNNPYPWTWEIPVFIMFVVALIAVVALHVGRSLANFFAGGGWRFPQSSEWFSSIPGVLMGDAAAGLPGVEVVAQSQTLLVWIAVSEVALLVALMAAGLIGWLRWGAPATKGMATRSEAEKMLGLRRIKKVRAVVRPDLYSGKR